MIPLLIWVMARKMYQRDERCLDPNNPNNISPFLISELLFNNKRIYLKKESILLGKPRKSSSNSDPTTKAKQVIFS